MARLAGQKLAINLAGTTAGYYLMSATVSLPAGRRSRPARSPDPPARGTTRGEPWVSPGEWAGLISAITGGVTAILVGSAD